MNVKFVNKGSRAEGLSYIVKFSINVFRILVIVIKFRPNLIISTGSAIAVPTFIFGKLLGSRTIFIESFCRVKTKTLTTKLIANLCNLLLVQWPRKVDEYKMKNCKYLGRLM
ncbi:MAG: hypothetical protein KKF00_08355 [Proteobacteria bacterium]|nr:hypothetical protein [Pseudomonadota bacterium]